MEARKKTYGRSIVFSALAGWAFFLLLPSGASAASYGNTAASESTQWNIDEGPPGSGAQNSTEGILQTFSVPNWVNASGLTLYLAELGATDGNVLVSLCLAPDRAYADPCSNGTANLLETWTITDGQLPTEFPVTTATTLDLGAGGGVQLWPGLSYGLWIRRTATTGVVQVAYTTGDYAAGDSYDTATGNSCSPEWISTTANSPGSCSATDTRDVRFHFSDLDDSYFTLSLSAIGGQLWARGACVQPSSLPEGWAVSRYVDIEYRHASATGTWLLGSAECADGSYDAGLRSVWNGEWLVVARQSGEPTSWDASATATIDVAGNPTENPVDALGLEDCGAYSLVVDLDGAVGCYFRGLTDAFRNEPPLQWYFQLASVFSATTTVPLELEFDLPGSSNTWLVYSSASNGGIVAALDATPEVLGMSWYELMDFGLWLSFGFYLIARGRSLV